MWKRRPAQSRHEAIDDKDAVHAWRAAQLMRLGVPGALASVMADRVDWHEVARLVSRGCPVQLALVILR